MSLSLIEELRANAAAHPLDVRQQVLADAAEALESQVREIHRLGLMVSQADFNYDCDRSNWQRELAALKAQPRGVVLDRQEAVNALYHCISGPGDCYAAARRVFDAGYRLNSSPVSAGGLAAQIRKAQAEVATWPADIREQNGISAGGVDERAAFEARFSKVYDLDFDEETEEYKDLGDQALWYGWQARAALSAPSHGEQVREGWQLVPFEPTREMISAASGAITTPDDLPPVGAGRWSMSDIAFRSRYRAALAAAPSPASQKEQGE